MKLRRFIRTIAAVNLLAVLGCDYFDEVVSPELSVLPGTPDGWAGGQGGMGGIGLTPTDRHGGTRALFVTGSNIPIEPTTRAAILTQTIRPDLYRGKRVRWSAWVKPLDVTDAALAGIWMRVDGPRGTVQLDNMQNRPVSGSSEWREISAVLDVPADALGISMGLQFLAHRTMLFDDFKFEIVGTDVPSTNMLTAVANPTASDSTAIASQYQYSRDEPLNADFEGIAPIGPATVDWLSRNSHRLLSTDPTAPLDDLEPLRQLIGSAHVVGLGEGTHGTREFFQMKHRILRFLVSKMGFTQFAIEATAPEAADINHFLLTGEGEPEQLLSRLYFWTWRTREVLDMILWMRDWNTTAPPAQRVQFHGFDIQHPGASIDSVVAFFGRVDSDWKRVAVASYACLDAFRNNGALPPARPLVEYSLSGNVLVGNCRTVIREIHDTLAARRGVYERASSPASYQWALRSARRIQQFERMISLMGAPAWSSALRDTAMAENLEWIREQSGGARVAVWAHNDHVAALPGAMGRLLRTANGVDYVSLGLTFGRGSFNAVEQLGVSSFGTVRFWSTDTVPNLSIEALFKATGIERALFDARLILAGDPAARSLAPPLAMRSIGSAFRRGTDLAYFRPRSFPGDFDLLIYLGSTNASIRLPVTP